MLRAPARAVLRSAFALSLTAVLISASPALAAAKPTLGSRTLGPGMTGPDVATLQTDLSKAGLRTPVGGEFGPITEHNVKVLQARYHLRVTGLADRGFVTALQQALSGQAGATEAVAGSGGTGFGSTPAAGGTKSKTNTKSATKLKTTLQAADPTSVTDSLTAPVVQDGGSQHLGERTLRPGMQGHDVRVLQGFLTLAGWSTPVDGSYGSTTKANVMAFERGNHLTPTNGTVTYNQSVLLRQLVAAALAGGAVSNATINSDGTASAPAGAPKLVQEVIAAANQIIDTPYVYGGGHGSWKSDGYDCSGSVSYALHGANLLSSPEDSTELESYGSPGPGKWITIYADASHTWIVVAGRAFDTAHYGATTPPGTGPRWLANPTGNLADGGNYVIRHPSGL